LFDVVLTNADPMHVMQNAGIFARYDSPADKNFPSDAIDPKLGPRYRNVIIGILYNKDLIAPADAPKSLEDLLKPQSGASLSCPIRRNTPPPPNGLPVYTK
jgi:ABC-type Fe3+ transport system substrate-binding protein